MKKNRREIIEYINDLKGFEGYVQFSHRPIDVSRDVFTDSNPKVEEESGFIYEAHFCNAEISIGIKQLNENWLISTTDIAEVETIKYEAIAGLKVKMAPIWKAESDILCEGMETLKLDRVVFAGFAKGEVS